MPAMDFSRRALSLILPLTRVTLPFFFAQSRFWETPRLKLSKATISPTPSFTSWYANGRPHHQPGGCNT